MHSEHVSAHLAAWPRSKLEGGIWGRLPSLCAAASAGGCRSQPAERSEGRFWGRMCTCLLQTAGCCPVLLPCSHSLCPLFVYSAAFMDVPLGIWGIALRTRLSYHGRQALHSRGCLPSGPRSRREAPGESPHNCRQCWKLFALTLSLQKTSRPQRK